MASGPYDLIVGIGFGGVLTLLFGMATGVRVALINPMYPIQRYLPIELPGYKYGDMLSRYEYKKICCDAKRESLKNVFLILGRDDDITDTARTPSYFCKGNSRFVGGDYFPDGDDFVRPFGELAGGIEGKTNESEDWLWPNEVEAKIFRYCGEDSPPRRDCLRRSHYGQSRRL